ncbi:MAG: alkaline phosphatase family protein [Clostridia bacterium]|nr:alkaline phosphatase family protein [Clostridia bacterium]
MKKWVKAVMACFIIAVIAVCITFPILSYTNPQPRLWAVEGDDSITAVSFEEEINSLDMMENTWQTAVPQTEIYKLVKSHFDAPLADGKTEKKAIVIGYDGCRVDTFRLLENSKESGINTLLSDGGHAVFCYCGGVNYPEKNIQDTSTAPGWCSMLTGVWADVHHVTGNGQPKEVEPRTLLLSLVEDKVIDSSAFYVSWNGHFTKDNATYINEKHYIEQNNINAVFLRAGNDIGTERNVLSDLNGEDCSDFIFLTLEYTDHNGHGTGFSLQNPKYVNGFRNADATGAKFIEAIKARPNYKNEDWLILITTDHGGLVKSHGGPSFEERITFIVSNQEIIK